MDSFLPDQDPVSCPSLQEHFPTYHSGSGTDWGSPSLEDACGLPDLAEAHPLAW